MANDFFGDLNEDFRNSEVATNPGLLPAGKYRAVLVENPYTKEGDDPVDAMGIESQNTGTKGLKIWFEILEPEKYSERVVEHVFWITEKTIPYLKKDLFTLLGTEVENLNDLLAGGVFAGNTAEIEVHHETFNDRTRARVKWILPWKEGSRAPNSETEEEVAF